MGLHTSYLGHFAIEPPLSAEEAEFFRSFGHTRHWDDGQPGGRLAVHPDDNEPTGDGTAYNRPAPGMPGLWCPWTVCQDGCCLRWDGAEKPYDADLWLQYLIDNVLACGAHTDLAEAHGLTGDHTLEGVVVGERRETGELFALEIVDNTVVRRTLMPKRPGVDEWGYASDETERQERRARLKERRKRFDRALAEDRLEQVG